MNCSIRLIYEAAMKTPEIKTPESGVKRLERLETTITPMRKNSLFQLAQREEK